MVILTGDSDEEAIVDFIKQHEELFDKTHAKFKDKQRKERLWETVAAPRNLPIRSGSRLNVPDTTCSHRSSEAKLQSRTQRDRPG